MVDCSHEIKWCLLLGRKAMTNLESTLKSRDITLPTKVQIVKNYWFFQWSCMDMRAGHKAGWVPKNWCFWTVVLEKTLQSPLDCKIKPINSKRNQPWLVTGRANAEAPILWPLDVKSQVIGKDLMLGKMEGKRRKWHKRWNGQIASLTQWIWIWTNSGRQWRTGEPGMLHAVHGVTKSRTQLSNWTTTTKEK